MKLLHLPVLLNEAIAGLAIKKEGCYVDATFGRGGHSLKILQSLGEQGRLLALDKDPAAVALAHQKPFCDDSRFVIEHAAFSQLGNLAAKHHFDGKVDGVLMDLGVSSPQLDNPERGFSFKREGPLDMRMNPQQGMDAAQWLNRADSTEIARVLREYGEERYARRIANAIVDARTIQPITTTQELASIIEKASPTREQKKHPATRTFQAIRIFINQELQELRECLEQCLQVMSVGGRICVISFHSLEDRIVKQFIAREAKGVDYPPELPIRDDQLKRRLRKVGSLIRPTSEEIVANLRARSARLRIAEKIA